MAGENHCYSIIFHRTVGLFFKTFYLWPPINVSVRLLARGWMDGWRKTHSLCESCIYFLPFSSSLSLSLKHIPGYLLCVNTCAEFQPWPHEFVFFSANELIVIWMKGCFIQSKPSRKSSCVQNNMEFWNSTAFIFFNCH